MKTGPFAAIFVALAAAVLFVPLAIPARHPIALGLALMGLELVLDAAFQWRLARLLGARSFVFQALLAPGTIVHELSHALLVVLTGAKLQKVTLFSPDAQKGTLGSVAYQVPADRWAVVRGAAIGMAPYLGCGGLFIGILAFLGPASLPFPALDPADLDALGRSALEILTFFGTWITDSPLGPIGGGAVFALAATIALGAAPSAQDFAPCFTVRSPVTLLLTIAVVGAALVATFVFPYTRRAALLVLGATAMAQVVAIVAVEVFATVRGLFARRERS